MRQASVKAITRLGADAERGRRRLPLNAAEGVIWKGQVIQSKKRGIHRGGSWQRTRPADTLTKLWWR